MSNSCTRSSPRVSRPAAPASRRKHGGVGHQPHRQVGRVEDLARGQRRERHLGGRDQPQVVALDVVGLVGELRQVPGRHHRRRAHDGRRADLLEGVGVAVERQLAQRPGQRGAAAPRSIGEHRPAHPRARARGRGCRARHRSPSAGPAGGRAYASGSKPSTRRTGLSASVAPSGASSDGRFGVRSRRSRRALGPRPRRHPRPLGLVTHGAAARRALVRARVSPALRAAPTCCDSRLISARQVVARLGEIAGLRIEPAQLVDDRAGAGRRDTSERGAHPFGIGADEADIDHGGGNGSVSGCDRPGCCRPSGRAVRRADRRRRRVADGSSPAR